jgi:hypothetical protein
MIWVNKGNYKLEDCRILVYTRFCCVKGNSGGDCSRDGTPMSIGEVSDDPETQVVYRFQKPDLVLRHAQMPPQQHAEEGEMDCFSMLNEADLENAIMWLATDDTLSAAVNAQPLPVRQLVCA